MKLNSKELGKTEEGWDIKVVTNEDNGKVTYIGYFEIGPTKPPVMYYSEHLEELKEKISKSKHNVKNKKMLFSFAR